MTSPPHEPEITARIAQTIQVWATIAGSLLIIGGFISKVWRPYIEWRRETHARMVRDILAPELQQLRDIIDRDDGCASRMEAVLEGMRAMYGDHDHLIEISLDNRDRLDEMNELFNALGFSSNRRTDEERRKLIDEMVDTLRARYRERDRDPDSVLHLPPS